MRWDLLVQHASRPRATRARPTGSLRLDRRDLVSAVLAQLLGSGGICRRCALRTSPRRHGDVHQRLHLRCHGILRLELGELPVALCHALFFYLGLESRRLLPDKVLARVRFSELRCNFLPVLGFQRFLQLSLRRGGAVDAGPELLKGSVANAGCCRRGRWSLRRDGWLHPGPGAASALRRRRGRRLDGRGRGSKLGEALAAAGSVVTVGKRGPHRRLRPRYRQRVIGVRGRNHATRELREQPRHLGVRRGWVLALGPSPGGDCRSEPS
mmetsp:Transcript_17377/g.47384  ORF Transcript_17377/g.47384 Transcript_17377/m.47384 type:complete len:268 (-) Transcript_17377:1195-1998(-)